jgi:hypothetical protein
MTLITSQKLGDIETGIKTAAESISFVQASDSNLATTTLQESLNILIRNSNAVSTTGAAVGGEADNAAISGTIPAPGAGKAIFLKSLTFSYSSNPASVRVLSIAAGGIELVKFGVDVSVNLTTGVITIFEDDGTTPFIRFQGLDANGQPSAIAAVRRVVIP